MIEFKLTDSQRFLCLCIRHCNYLNTQEIRSMYTKIGDEKLFKEASLNGVVPIVAHALDKVFLAIFQSTGWLNIIRLASELNLI